MNTLSANSTVNRQEAEALKEMIFNRVRARAEAMNKEVQASYVDNVQNELMDLARTSFVSNKNPFSNSKPQVKTETQAVEEEVTVDKQEFITTTSLDFEQYKKPKLSSQVKLNINTSNEEIARSTIASTMNDARESLKNRSTFMGALNFLNSQASIALVNKKSKSFEATA